MIMNYLKNPSKIVKFKYLLIILLFSPIVSKSAETLLWRVSSEKGVVYMLGSIHLADSSLYPLHPAIESSFEESDALVLEIVIDKISPMEIMNYLTFKDERTLESELEPGLFKKIAQKFEANNIPRFLYNKFKPWFAVMYLQSDSYKSSGFSAAEGIDMYFLDKARKNNKEVMEIESLKSQMELMDELGEFTGDYLQFMVDELDSSDDAIKEIINAWKSGDDKTIEKLSNHGSENKEFALVMEKLNYKRNEKMVEKIIDYLNQDKTYFVVVGAAHLIGERGVINLLKNNGYKIKRF